MKTFLFSICALTIVIVLIVCNAFYVKSLTNELQLELESLSPCDLLPTRAIFERWRGAEKTLELSVSAVDITDVSNRLSELCTAAQFNDEEAFERARALCLDSIARIRDLERFSLLHIL